MATKTEQPQHFSVEDIEVGEASRDDLERNLRPEPRRGIDPTTEQFLEELAAGAIKRVRFSDQQSLRGQYMSLARMATWRGMYLQRVPDQDDPLVSYIRKVGECTPKGRGPAQRKDGAS